jgi:spore germination protein YaaH
MFDNWRGVYDYKALADALDFISYMTSPAWGSRRAGSGYLDGRRTQIRALARVPAVEVARHSAYSDWWYSSYDAKTGARVRGNDISYPTAVGLLSRFGAQPIWDDREKSPYAFWSNNGVYEWLWMEDARAFMAKLALVRQYSLRGYSVWVLGLEDPKTWEALAAAAEDGLYRFPRRRHLPCPAAPP